MRTLTFGVLTDLLGGYLEAEGALLSANTRTDEDPPSATYHCQLDGREYVLILQPTAMADRAA